MGWLARHVVIQTASQFPSPLLWTLSFICCFLIFFMCFDGKQVFPFGPSGYRRQRALSLGPVCASGQDFTADCTGVTTRPSHSSTKTSAESPGRPAVTHSQHSGSLWSGGLWPGRESVRVPHAGQSGPQRLHRATGVTAGSRLDRQGRGVCVSVCT